jgi:hypothetical protein
MISDYIQEGGMARLETVDGVGGVLFMDEGEFIPWRDLGYNPTYGFYRLSHLPWCRKPRQSTPRGQYIR